MYEQILRFWFEEIDSKMWWVAEPAFDELLRKRFLSLIHSQAENLFMTWAPEENYRYELRHKAIIDRFDRYPHRNKILGRLSSAEEIEFLEQPGSRF